MDQANDSKVPMVDEKGGLLSRRRVLQSAAVATVGLAIGRAGTPLGCVFKRSTMGYGTRHSD